MAAFERKTVKFPTRGMNWNRPADAVPDEQGVLMRNVRMSQQGEITSRPGLSLFADMAIDGDVDIHSISRMNNSHGAQHYSYEYVVGIGTKLRVGKDGVYLMHATPNPVKLPYYPSGGTWVRLPLSGLPLSFVDMTPIGTPFAFKYIGDQSQMLSIGYYPGDLPDYTPLVPPVAGYPSMARANYMGLPIPVNQVVPVAIGGAGGGGPLSGAYQWAFAYRNRFTGARSNPSAPTRVTLASPYLVLDEQSARFTLPNAPYDPQNDVLTPDPNIYIDVYRLGGTIDRWVYVGTGNSGDTFDDTYADEVLQTSPSPPSATDPVTGVTRFTQYAPFVTQDRAHFGNATLSATGTGTYILTRSTGDYFNTRWFQGSYIGVNQGNFSIFQVLSDTVLELTEDASGAVEGGAVPWSTPEGTLKHGTALPHIWGPFSTGTGGAFVFGVGNAEAPGDLYWTNGNDPDSTDVVNSLTVTSATEPLVNGCMVDGTCLLWSTERMFRVYPSLIAPGQFQVEEVPGGKGIWAPYSLTTQTTGVAEHVTWLGRDGVYNWSIASGLECLTDAAMYPFFIHDNTSPRTLAQIFPWLVNESWISKPDFSYGKLRYHRLTWFDGLLFYDFPQTTIGAAGTTYATLVYDSKQAKGWVSIDLFGLDDAGALGYVNTKPTSRAFEIGGFKVPGGSEWYNANNLLVGCGNQLYNYGGTTDNGNAIFCRLITRAEDMGDPRLQKLWGDYILDCNPGGNTVHTAARTDFSIDTVVAESLAGSARDQFVVDFNLGLGLLSPTFALDVDWTGAGVSYLYQYQPSFVPKPEISKARATDWTDDGEPGDKWVYGCLIEANTFSVNRQIEVQGDNGVVIATLTINHGGQSTKPYSFTSPAITHQLRCVPVEPSTWELFRFIPKWTKKPELTKFHSDWTDDGKPQPKYLQGFVLQADTEGEDVTLELWCDQTLIHTFTVNHDGELEKPYPLAEPPTIHLMKLIPSGNNIRYLENFKVGWVYVAQPEFTMWVPDYTPSDPTAYHGVAIEADTQGEVIEVDVVSEGAVVRTLSVNHDGRVQKAYSFGAPFISTEIKLVPKGNWRQYPEWKVRWIGYPKPDLAALWTDWTDDGYEGAKFVQGFVLQADTGGLDCDFTVQYDGGQVAQVFQKINHNGEREMAYSFMTPFIAHQLRCIPSIPIRYDQNFKIRWVWEPAPELAKNWITQTTSHGLQGWYHHRDCYIALQSYDYVTLRITDTSGTVNSYVFASTVGTVQKLYEVLRPQKAKLVSYSLTSCVPFRLFQKDCEVRVAQWSRGTSEYMVTKPFGGPHYERGAFI
jgi:hypothetical protein